MPRFKFFLSNRNNPVREDDPIWSIPIPLSRSQAAGTFVSSSDLFFSHGDCFSAARDFLEKDGFAILSRAVSHHFERRIPPEEIDEIRIILDKHGEFYHPAKIETVLKDAYIPFVLNIAVTEMGKECAQREYRHLKMLDTDYPHSFVPKVYAQGKVFAQMNQAETWMFLGDWFEGFNEFHISIDPSDGKCKIIVWDHENGNFFLTAQQSISLYQQAAKILTCYYNVETFEQILSWHHAAGDFVLKCHNEDVEVKLVTVRQYRSMFEQDIHDESKAQDPELILEALLVFFLNMAIKMRIDRLDGVGEIVWSDDVALKGILNGFFEGLALKRETGVFAKPLDDCFRQHLLACSPADFMDLNNAIVHGYPSQSPEVPVIRRHLEMHIEGLYNSIIRLKKCDGTDSK